MKTDTQRTRRVVMAALGGITAVGLLAGCGSSTPGQSAGGGDDSSGKTTIEFWHRTFTPPENTWYKDIVKKFNASQDKIVVKAIEAELTTPSGLVIPDTAKEKPQEGEVVAVGPGRVSDSGERIPVDVAVGDKVLFSKYGGTEVKHGGEEFLILNARDVLAVIA